MTFFEMMQTVIARSPDLTPEDARMAVMMSILDGYDTRSEALEAYEELQEREVVGHTPQGWPISPELLLHAVHLAEKYPPPLRVRERRRHGR